MLKFIQASTGASLLAVFGWIALRSHAQVPIDTGQPPVLYECRGVNACPSLPESHCLRRDGCRWGRTPWSPDADVCSWNYVSRFLFCDGYGDSKANCLRQGGCEWVRKPMPLTPVPSPCSSDSASDWQPAQSAGQTIRYYYTWSTQRGKASLAPGTFFELYRGPGGGPQKFEVARCYLNHGNELIAYHWDSASARPVCGRAVKTGCSTAAWHEFDVQCCFPAEEVNIVHRYSFSMAMPESVAMIPGELYEIYNAPGGGRHGNDVARCIYNANGTLTAFNKDSAALHPVMGHAVPRNSGKCSVAAWGQYTVSCCFQ